MRTQTRGSATPAAPTQTAIAGLAAVGLAAVICCAGALPASAAGPSGPPRPVPAPTPPPNSRAILAWGSNAYGELGIGTTTDSDVPVIVQAPGATQYTVVKGMLSSYAVTAGGKLYAWGLNSVGQLGDGTKTMRLKPVQVKLPAGVKVTALVAGKYFSMALTSKHNIMTWGSNDSGELGNGTTAGSSTPVNVSLPPFTAYAIGAGWGSSTALTTGKFQPL